MITSMVRSWNAMSTVRKIRRVVSIGLIGFAFWALTPYLYSRRVDEAFPAAAPVPTAMADTAAIAQSKPTAMADTAAIAQSKPTAMADTAAIAQSKPTTVPEAPIGPVALAHGSLVPGSTPGDRASGSATIYQLEDKSHVLRLEDFATTNGPDLFVVLSGSTNPDAEGIGDKQSYVQLAALKGNKGNQNYELPAGIDPNSYKSVVIWCRAFNIVFGYAPLQPSS